jgi:hypothetical protein
VSLIQREAARIANTRHGMSDSRIYHIWEAIIQRCLNPKNPNYENYGKRGINICDEWKIFENFLTWTTNSNYSDSLEIERINNNLGYFPENCIWSTRSIQCFNKRSGRNTSGRIGVSWDNTKNKWKSELVKNGIKVLFKRFDNFEEAVQAIEKAELENFGFIRNKEK